MCRSVAFSWVRDRSDAYVFSEGFFLDSMEPFCSWTGLPLLPEIRTAICGNRKCSWELETNPYPERGWLVCQWRWTQKYWRHSGVCVCGGGRRPRAGDLCLLRWRPHRLWTPPTILFKGLRDCFSGVKRPSPDGDHVQLVPMLRMKLYIHSPIHLHDVCRNDLTVWRRRGTSFSSTESVAQFPEGTSWTLRCQSFLCTCSTV